MTAFGVSERFPLLDPERRRHGAPSPRAGNRAADSPERPPRPRGENTRPPLAPPSTPPLRSLRPGRRRCRIRTVRVKNSRSDRTRAAGTRSAQTHWTHLRLVHFCQTQIRHLIWIWIRIRIRIWIRHLRRSGAVNVVVGFRAGRGSGGCSYRGVSEGAPACPQAGCQPEEKRPRAAGVQRQGAGRARGHQKQSSRVHGPAGGVRARPRGRNTPRSPDPPAPQRRERSRNGLALAWADRLKGRSG